MPQANYRITDRRGREVDVYIKDTQLSWARSGVLSSCASICINFREARISQHGIDTYVQWADIVDSITPLAGTSRTTGRLVSNADLLHQQEWSGECCDNDTCVDCSGDAYRSHANCRNGCTLTQSFSDRS